MYGWVIEQYVALLLLIIVILAPNPRSMQIYNSKIMLYDMYSFLFVRRWRNKTFTTDDTAGEIITRVLLCLPFHRVSKLITCDRVAAIGWWRF